MSWYVREQPQTRGAQIPDDEHTSFVNVWSAIIPGVGGGEGRGMGHLGSKHRPGTVTRYLENRLRSRLRSVAIRAVTLNM